MAGHYTTRYYLLFNRYAMLQDYDLEVSLKELL